MLVFCQTPGSAASVSSHSSLHEYSKCGCKHTLLALPWMLWSNWKMCCIKLDTVCLQSPIKIFLFVLKRNTYIIKHTYQVREKLPGSYLQILTFIKHCSRFIKAFDIFTLLSQFIFIPRTQTPGLLQFISGLSVQSPRHWLNVYLHPWMRSLVEICALGLWNCCVVLPW